MQFELSAPTKNQLKKVAVAAVFSFVSAFLTVFMAAGGVHADLRATIAVTLAAGVAGINAALYTVWQFFKKDTTTQA